MSKNWREAHAQVKMHTTNHILKLGSRKKKCSSQNVNNMKGSDTFGRSHAEKNTRPCGRIHISNQNGKIICRKIARCSGKKHISKSKCQKHGGLRLFWKDTCSTVLQREAHLQVKMHQKHAFGPLLKVQVSKNWRACPSQNAHSRPHLESRIGVFRLLFGRSYAEKTRCGRKDISKSNVKTSKFEPPLEDHIPKKTVIVAGNIFQVKPLFEVHAVAKNRFPIKISKTNHFWKITCQQCGKNHTSTSTSQKCENVRYL